MQAEGGGVLLILSILLTGQRVDDSPIAGLHDGKTLVEKLNWENTSEWKRKIEDLNATCAHAQEDSSKILSALERAVRFHEAYANDIKIPDSLIGLASVEGNFN